MSPDNIFRMNRMVFDIIFFIVIQADSDASYNFPSENFFIFIEGDVSGLLGFTIK